MKLPKRSQYLCLLGSLSSSRDASFQKRGGRQPGLLGVATTPKCKRVLIGHKERDEFGGSDQRVFDNHVSYNMTNVFYGVMKIGNGGLRACP